MSDRTCPNCAQVMKEGSSTCTCGFMWDDGVDVPSPEIVRTAARTRSAVERLESEEQPEPTTKATVPSTAATTAAKPAPAAAGSALSVLDDDLDLPPLPWETQGEVSTQPRHEPHKTAPTETPMPRVTDHPVDLPTETAGVIPPTAARYQRSTSGTPTSSTTTANTTAPRTTETGTNPTRQPKTALLMDCPACGVRISKRAETCPKCASAPWDHCQICATRILVNSATCPECGDPAPFETAAG